MFVLLAAGAVVGGNFYYKSYERQYRGAVEHQLVAIADLKVRELATWRKERISDGSVLFQNPAFSALLRRVLDRPGDAATERQLQVWIEKLRTNYGYDRVRVLDTHGATRLASPVGLDPVSSDILGRASEVLRSGQIAFQDFYRNERDQRIYLAVLVPIFDDTDAGRPLGTLVLRVDPETYLYPFIERWPTPSATAETLLVRRDGDEVVFLNPLRFQPNTPLTLRAPLTSANLPAAQAVLGREGAMQGTDYRGVPVLAVTRVISDSPWSLVARIDIAEVD
ncbi:MAG: cache domain-containing protein, partial [Acidobacteriota bacterium]